MTLLLESIMSTDARWTVGTGLTVIAIMLVLFAALGNRIDRLEDRIERLDARLDTVEASVKVLEVRVTNLEGER